MHIATYSTHSRNAFYIAGLETRSHHLETLIETYDNHIVF